MVIRNNWTITLLSSPFTTLPFFALSQLTASPVSSLELGLIEGRRRRPGYWLEITMLRYLVPRLPQVNINLLQLPSLHPLGPFYNKVEEIENRGESLFSIEIGGKNFFKLFCHRSTTLRLPYTPHPQRKKIPTLLKKKPIKKFCKLGHQLFSMQIVRGQFETNNFHNH